MIHIKKSRKIILLALTLSITFTVFPSGFFAGLIANRLPSAHILRSSISYLQPVFHSPDYNIFRSISILAVLGVTGFISPVFLPAMIATHLKFATTWGAIGYVAWNLKDNKKDLGKIKKTTKKIDKKADKINTNLQILASDVGRNHQDITLRQNATDKSIDDKFQVTMGRFNETDESIAGVNKKLNENHEQTMEEIQVMQEEARGTRKKLDEVGDGVTLANNNIDALSATVEMVKKDVAESEVEAKKRDAAMQQHVVNLKRGMEGMGAQINNIETGVKTNTQQLNNVDKRLTGLENGVNDLNGKVDKMLDDAQESEDRAKALRLQVQDLFAVHTEQSKVQKQQGEVQEQHGKNIEAIRTDLSSVSKDTGYLAQKAREKEKHKQEELERKAREDEEKKRQKEKLIQEGAQQPPTYQNKNSINRSDLSANILQRWYSAYTEPQWLSEDGQQSAVSKNFVTSSLL